MFFFLWNSAMKLHVSPLFMIVYLLLSSNRTCVNYIYLCTCKVHIFSYAFGDKCTHDVYGMKP